MAANERDRTPTSTAEAVERATSSLGDDGTPRSGAAPSPQEGMADPPANVSGLLSSVQPGGAPDEPGSLVADTVVTGGRAAAGSPASPAERRDRAAGQNASLHDQSADQIRNRQRGGLDIPAPQPDAPESNATLDRAWSDPGGEAYNFRNSQVGAGGKADNHTDLVEAETPAETIRHLSDATLSPQDGDATAEAIARMAAAGSGKAS